MFRLNKNRNLFRAAVVALSFIFLTLQGCAHSPFYTKEEIDKRFEKITKELSNINKEVQAIRRGVYTKIQVNKKIIKVKEATSTQSGKIKDLRLELAGLKGDVSLLQDEIE